MNVQNYTVSVLTSVKTCSINKFGGSEDRFLFILNPLRFIPGNTPPVDGG